MPFDYTLVNQTVRSVSIVGIVLIAAVPAAGSEESADTERPLGVCDLLHKRKKMHKKRVEVQGLLKSGRFGTQLWDKSALLCELDGRGRAPAALHLVLPRADDSIIPDGPRKWPVSAEKVYPALQRLAERMKVRGTSEVAVTLAGEVRSRSRVRIEAEVVGGEVRSKGDGYGHRGAFGAALLVAEVAGVREPDKP